MEVRGPSYLIHGGGARACRRRGDVRTTLAVRAAAVLLTGVATATSLAACGGSSNNGANAANATNSSTSGTRPNASAIQAYVTCLGQHGVKLDLPTGRPSFTRGPRPSGAPRPTRSGGFGGGGFGGGFGGGGFGGLFGDPNNPPAGGDAATWSAALTACKSLQPSFGGRGNGGGFNNSAFTAYRNCLQSHGVTFSQGPQGLSTSDPKVAAALKACAPLRPTGRPTAAPSPTG